jgi:hypothetical protein
MLYGSTRVSTISESFFEELSPDNLYFVGDAPGFDQIIIDYFDKNLFRYKICYDGDCRYPGKNAEMQQVGAAHIKIDGELTPKDRYMIYMCDYALGYIYSKRNGRTMRKITNELIRVGKSSDIYDSQGKLSLIDKTIWLTNGSM